jgi:hypothetical protein
MSWADAFGFAAFCLFLAVLHRGWPWKKREDEEDES